MWLIELAFFLNSANLKCRSTDISKYFRESLGLRDKKSQLYLFDFFLFHFLSVLYPKYKKKKKKKNSILYRYSSVPADLGLCHLHMYQGSLFVWQTIFQSVWGEMHNVSCYNEKVVNIYTKVLYNTSWSSSKGFHQDFYPTKTFIYNKSFKFNTKHNGQTIQQMTFWFFWFFQENRLWHLGDSLHEMPKPVFRKRNKKNINLSYTESAKRVVKVSSGYRAIWRLFS